MMDYYFVVVIVCLLMLALAFAGYMGIRNCMVHDELCRINNRVSDRSRRDIDAHRDDWHRWREEFSEGPSYDQMMLQFWRPVRSFYPPLDKWNSAAV